MKKNFFFFVLGLTTLICFGMNAQSQLILKLKNNSSETFDISNIRSIKFSESDLNLHKKDGTVQTWKINDIANYSFTIASATESVIDIQKSDLNVFPNPVSNNATIQYFTPLKEKVMIDIVDGSGKLVQTIYQGVYQGGQVFQWTPNLPPGIYCCRLLSESNIVSKPFIVL